MVHHHRAGRLHIGKERRKRGNIRQWIEYLTHPIVIFLWDVARVVRRCETLTFRNTLRITPSADGKKVLPVEGTIWWGVMWLFGVKVLYAKVIQSPSVAWRKINLAIGAQSSLIELQRLSNLARSISIVAGELLPIVVGIDLDISA